MSRALRIIRLIEGATEPQEPKEPDPAGDKDRKNDQKGLTGSGAFARKKKKYSMLDGSYDEEPGFYIGCPKCGEVGANRQPKGDIRDTLCSHCEEPLVVMGSVDSKVPADKKVVQRGKEREQQARKKNKK
jgi:hypothetical protein